MAERIRHGSNRRRDIGIIYDTPSGRCQTSTRWDGLNLKLILSILLGSAVYFLFMPAVYLKADAPVPKVCFKSGCVKVEMAETPDEISRGLMYRRDLGSDKGMIFVFDEEKIHSFWMENTLIPLDMIWISGDLKIVRTESAVPCGKTACRIYNEVTPSKYVVEVNAGYVDKKGLKIGEKVELSW
jgi:uncharacterized membrane protein (UPF0127 family)